ncbi:MAG: tape measure protein, partial [Plesiomonas shigelloides]
MTRQAQTFRAGLADIHARYQGTGNQRGFQESTSKLIDQNKRLVAEYVKQQRALRESQYLQESFNTSLSSMAKGLVSAYAAIEGFRMTLTAGLERNSADMATDVIYGRYDKENGRDNAKQAKLFAAEFSEQLGMNQTDMLRNLTGFTAAAAPSMGLDMSQEFFKNQQIYGRLRGMSEEKMKLAALAFQQMAGKGTVSAEELKGQLAEALPGAESLFAKAIYGDDSAASIKKMMDDMKKGNLHSADALKKVNAEMAKQNEQAGGLAKISEQTQVSLGRMWRAINNFLINIERGFDKSFGRMVASISALFENATVLGEGFGSALGFIMDVLGDLIGWIAVGITRLDGYIMLLKLWYKELGETNPALKKTLEVVMDIAKWLAEIGIGAIAALTVIKAISSLVGILASVKNIGALLGGATAVAEGAAIAGGAAAATGGLSALVATVTPLVLGVLGIASVAGIGYWLYTLWDKAQNDPSFQQAATNVQKNGMTPMAPVAGTGFSDQMASVARQVAATKSTLTVNLLQNGKPLGQKMIELSKDNTFSMNTFSDHLDTDRFT